MLDRLDQPFRGFGDPCNCVSVFNNNAPSQVYLYQSPVNSKTGLWATTVYANDAWQVNNRLTLNLGVRLDRFQPFLPEQIGPAGQNFAAVDEILVWKNIGPRLGASYDISGKGKTVVKFNYGRYWLYPAADFANNINPNPAPVEAPPEIKPEAPPAAPPSVGVPGGVVGGVPGGSLGGVVGGLPEAPPPPPPPAPVRVGGNIRQPQKTRNVQPVYPQIAQSARVQGVVIIEATISPAGKVVDARILRSIPLLDQAALDAVRQWEYSPTLLNGVPVPVIMTVTVNFTLQS